MKHLFDILVNGLGYWLLDRLSLTDLVLVGLLLIVLVCVAVGVILGG